MDVVVFCLVVVGLTAFVAAPLYRPRPKASRDDADRAATAARRLAVDVALADLEVDRASGLITSADHEREQAALASEAARLAHEDTPND